jgi:hypothetical protein
MAQAMAAAMAAVQSLPGSSANAPFSPNSAAFSNMAAAAAAAAAAAVASINGSGRQMNRFFKYLPLFHGLFLHLFLLELPPLLPPR